MATKETGGYSIDLPSSLEDKGLSSSLSIYIDGMMAFAYDDFNISNEDQIELLNAIILDLKKTIDSLSA